MRHIITTLLLVLPSAALADGIYGGNPTLSLQLDRSEDDISEAVVTIDTVDIVYCDDTVDTYTVEEEVDLALGWDLDIEAGCLRRVVVDWDSDIEVEGTGFTLEITRNQTTVPINPPIPGQVMAPFTVVSGSISGSDPVLWTSIQ